MDPLTIGKVARLAGVGVETVRFYERQGLIDEPPRRLSGYRQYPPETVSRVRFIRHAKELGFSLKEIKELQELRIDPDATCHDVRQRTRAKIQQIEEKIRSLQRIQQALQKLEAACDGAGSVSTCPVLNALEGGNQS
jgi:MerR family mercuric resistance operon transcriptional regulator